MFISVSDEHTTNVVEAENLQNDVENLWDLRQKLIICNHKRPTPVMP